MRLVGIVLVGSVALGCGRIGFDRNGAGGDSGVGTLSCSPQPEVCDGLDNDCNGEADEPCACNALDGTITGAFTVNEFPPVASLGDDLAVLVTLAGKPTLVVISGTGTSVSSQMFPITTSLSTSVAARAGLRWNGTDFTAVVGSGGGMHYVRFDPAGTVLQEFDFAAGSNRVRTVSPGTALAYVGRWQVAQVLNFHLIDEAGTEQAGGVRISAAETPQALTWDGSAFLLAWTTDDGKHFKVHRIGPDQTVLAGPAELAATVGAFSGTELGIAPLPDGAVTVLATSPNPSWIVIDTALQPTTSTTIPEGTVSRVELARVGSSIAYARWAELGGSAEARLSIHDPSGTQQATYTIYPATTMTYGGVSLVSTANSVTAVGMAAGTSTNSLFVRRICR